MRPSRLLLIGLAFACATDAQSRRLSDIRKLEYIIPKVAPDAPELPELLFHLGYKQFEQGEFVAQLDGGTDEARSRARSARASYDRVLNQYPTYARRDEVTFCRAETLSFLGEWPQAAESWDGLVRDGGLQGNNVLFARCRLFQALRNTGRCEPVDARGADAVHVGCTVTDAGELDACLADAGVLAR